MKFLMLAASAVALAAVPAQAALVGDFQLNNSYANAVVSTLTMGSNGGVLGSQGITFGANQGPTVFGLTSLRARAKSS